MQNKPISDELLFILVCPETKTTVTLADQDLISRINQLIASGAIVKNPAKKAADPIEAGLIREDKKILYPIVEGIPVMLIEEGLVLENTI